MSFTIFGLGLHRDDSSRDVGRNDLVEGVFDSVQRGKGLTGFSGVPLSFAMQKRSEPSPPSGGAGSAEVQKRSAKAQTRRMICLAFDKLAQLVLQHRVVAPEENPPPAQQESKAPW